MAEVIVKDDGGRDIHFFSFNGCLFPTTDPVSRVMDTHKSLPSLKCRDSDIMLCNFPKTGTNWLYEILSMILNESAESVPTSKIATMIEISSQESMDELPSPRILNTHLKYSLLPKDMRTKGIKTVFILRNPKDTAVSYFNHMKGIKSYGYIDGQFKDWLGPYLKGEYEYGKYSDYLLEWEKAIEAGVGFPLHVMYYEDLKDNFQDEIDKLCRFLGIELDAELKESIKHASGFERMSKDKISPLPAAELKEGFGFFRKGQIGDWTNWLTVQQNADFDKLWDAEMKGSKFVFKYIPILT